MAWNEKTGNFIILLLAAMLLLGTVQFSHVRLHAEDYFHLRTAVMLREQGIVREFPWLKHTILNRDYADLHFLYHVLLVPFSFGNLFVGGKIAAIVFSLALVVVFYRFLNRNEVPYPVFWTLFLFAGSSIFLTRCLAVRPVSLAVIFCILYLDVLFQKRYLWIILLSYLFVLSTSFFPTLFVIVVSFTIVSWIHRGELNVRPLLYSFAGITLGLVINPYFPKNLGALYSATLRTLFSSAGLQLTADALPVSSWVIFLGSWSIYLAVFAVLTLFLKNGGRRSFNVVYLFIACMTYLLTHLRYARGVDQFVPFAVLFCAFALTVLNYKTPKGFLLIRVSALSLIAVMNILFTVSGMRADGGVHNEGSALWLRENTPAGSEVFLTDYQTFSELFFYNQHNVYTLGINPVFMRDHDPALYALYREVLDVENDVQRVLKEDFGAQYIHVRNVPEDRGLYSYLQDNPRQFKMVYGDDFATVYEIR